MTTCGICYDYLDVEENDDHNVQNVHNEDTTVYTVYTVYTVCTKNNNAFRGKRRLLCGHVFCASCISKWKAGKNATCPYCRQPLSRRYHAEKHKRERRHVENMQHVKRLIDHMEKQGYESNRDGDEFQMKRFQLYERLDTLERRSSISASVDREKRHAF